MAKALGMAINPWNVLGGGFFKTEEEFAKIEQSGLTPLLSPNFCSFYNAGEKVRIRYDLKYFEKCKQIVKVLQKIANAHKCTTTGVALAYVLHKVQKKRKGRGQSIIFPLIFAFYRHLIYSLLLVQEKLSS